MMQFKDYSPHFSNLPLRLMKVVIEQDGIKQDAKGGPILSFVHEAYKSYIDEIGDAGGYVLVKVDSNGNPMSFEVKDVPQELLDKIK